MFSEPKSIFVAATALVVVLALVWGTGRLARVSGLVRQEGRLLAVEESVALDTRRRLSVLRCGDERFVLLTGGASDVVVSRGRVESATRVLILAMLVGVVAMPAWAQSVAIDLGAPNQAGATGRLEQLTALITVLALAPSLLVMVTAFTRIVILLSLLHSALSTQGTPPNTVLIGLALFLSFFVMQPVLDAAWQSGLGPMTRGELEEIEGIRRAMLPFHDFMLANLRPENLRFFLDLGGLPTPAAPAEAPWRAVVPAFVIGELRRGFEMGFLLFLPFLVIDMVVASVLMSLGMMMLPPNAVSLPFKLIFFVLVNGWRLVSGGLVGSFVRA